MRAAASTDAAGGIAARPCNKAHQRESETTTAALKFSTFTSLRISTMLRGSPRTCTISRFLMWYCCSRPSALGGRAQLRHHLTCLPAPAAGSTPEQAAGVAWQQQLPLRTHFLLAPLVLVEQRDLAALGKTLQGWMPRVTVTWSGCRVSRLQGQAGRPGNLSAACSYGAFVRSPHPPDQSGPTQPAAPTCRKQQLKTVCQLTTPLSIWRECQHAHGSWSSQPALATAEHRA